MRSEELWREFFGGIALCLTAVLAGLLLAGMGHIAARVSRRGIRILDALPFQAWRKNAERVAFSSLLPPVARAQGAYAPTPPRPLDGRQLAALKRPWTRNDQR